MGEIQKHHRRSIRLPGYDYASPGNYYVTICTHHFRPIFGRVMNGNMQLGELGEIAYKSWRETTSHFSNVELGPFIVMPNHVHGIVTITDDPGRGTACCAPTADDSASKSFGKLVPGSIPVIVRSYKSAVANQIHKSQPNIHALIWQRNYFEHIITSDEDYARIAAYIEFNSENWLADEENREYS